MRHVRLQLLGLALAGGLLVGCETKVEKEPVKLPPPGVPSALNDRFLLKLGNPAELDDPRSAWCYLDIEEGSPRVQGHSLVVDPWRPDEQYLRCTTACYVDGTVMLVLEREYELADGEVEVSETWQLQGRLRRTKPPGAALRPKPDDEEEYEEDEEEYEEEWIYSIVGEAHVSVTSVGETVLDQTRRLRFKALSVEDDAQTVIGEYEAREEAKSLAAVGMGPKPVKPEDELEIPEDAGRDLQRDASIKGRFRGSHGNFRPDRRPAQGAGGR